MLAKDPAVRVQDAEALGGELAALPAFADQEPPTVSVLSTPVSSLGSGEQQLVSIIVAVRRNSTDTEMPTMDLRSAATREEVRMLRQLMAPYGAQVEMLVDGSVVATLVHANTGSATDQVLQAARCALILKDHWPEVRVGLVTGRGVLAEQMPLGEAIERAWHLLLRRTTGSSGNFSGNRPVWLDEVTARLLETRFEVTQAETDCFMLGGERASLDPTRPLLGRPTLCVGRDRELALLDSLFTECRDEPNTQAVVVTAPAGLGKSRLRHEFLRRLQERQESVEILIGRGDPMSIGTPYGLLGQAIRRLCKVIDGEPKETQEDRLRLYFESRVPAAEVQRIVEFIGELCGVFFSADASPPLRAARQDPRIMNDQLQQVMLEWLRIECARQPVLLVLEDLHWGDPLTVRLIDVLLRELGDAPLMVLALARPEIASLFPKLWKERRLLELSLDGLTRKASERLIQHVLGKQVSEAAMARIVAQAAGNALFLEELIRSAVEHKGELPETVLAMLQSRLMRLAPSARRLLRSASIFGETFWQGGLSAFQSDEDTAAELDTNFEELVEQEIIERHRQSRIANEIQYGFRHGLMRDAAYALLSEAECQRGHRLAGQYLETRIPGEPLLLAEHFQRSDERTQAVRWFLQAAEQAMSVHDLEGTLRCADAGVACMAEGEPLGRLRCLQAWASIKQHSYLKGYPLAKEAIALLPAGNRWWCETMSALFTCAGLLDPAAMPELLGRFATAEPAPDALGRYIEAGAYLVIMFGMVGQRAPALAFLGRLQQLSGLVSDADARARGWLHLAAACHFHYLDGDVWTTYTEAQQAAAAFRMALDLRDHCFCAAMIAHSQLEMGNSEEAEREFRANVQAAEKIGEPMALANMKTDLAHALSVQNDAQKAQEALVLTQEVINISGINPYDLARAHTVAARLALRQKQLEEAESHARKACELCTALPIAYFAAAAVLIDILLVQGRLDEAYELAQSAFVRLRDMGGCGASETPLFGAVCKAYRASGQSKLIQSVLEFARSRIQPRANAIPDAVLRQSFLNRACAVFLSEEKAEHASLFAFFSESRV